MVGLILSVRFVFDLFLICVLCCFCFVNLCLGLFATCVLVFRYGPFVFVCCLNVVLVACYIMFSLVSGI